VEPEEFFAGQPFALSVYEGVRATIEAIGPAEVRTTRGQVAFRRRRGFAWLWLPGRWLTRPDAEIVLSVALPERRESARWKEVVHPSPRVWMHHLEIQALDDLDDEVDGWLREAWATAD
jgi:hypothetical protein